MSREGRLGGGLAILSIGLFGIVPAADHFGIQLGNRIFAVIFIGSGVALVIGFALTVHSMIPAIGMQGRRRGAVQLSQVELELHLNEIKEIALELRSGMGEKLSFGVDATRKRHKLIRHFPGIRKQIERWDAVHEKWLAAQAAAGQRAKRLEKSLNLGGAGFWELLQMAAWYRATGGGMGSPFGAGLQAHNGAVWAKVPSSNQPVQVALYQGDFDKEDKLKRMQAALDSTRHWRETRRWNRAQRDRGAIRSQLSDAISDVVNHHVLRGHCDYC